MKKLLFILSLAFYTMVGQAQNANLRQTVEEGIRTSIQQTENREWKEAFATCLEMDALIHIEERKTKMPAPELHYLVTKERLRMYLRLNNNERSKEQLEKMEVYANQSQQVALQEDLLMSQAKYYQKFGMTDQSLQCYKQLVQKRSSGKDEAGVEACFKEMLQQAGESGNTALTHALDKLYSHWLDSVKTVKAAQALQALQDDYNVSRQEVQQKEEKISTQQGIMVVLLVVAIALVGALLLFLGILTKNFFQIKKLKHSLDIANSNNEQKSRFISHIGQQMLPSLEVIETSPAQSKKHIDGLKGLIGHVQHYMALESSREELYEVKDMNIYTLCESIFQQAKKSFQPEVSGVLQVPRVNIRTNAKALEEILLYLLNNAAMHTESGKISLEFKKRSAHTGQFIVTDTGIGIPEEKWANLFKPFAGVQDLTEGDGLGLPTCSLIAYKLNGTLRLDEEYKKGARFVLELKA